MTSFNKARLKLTLWYVVISYALLAVFTVAVLSAERQAFGRVIDLVHSNTRGVVFNVYLQQQIADFETSFAQWLIIFDIAILLIAAAVSYFLSGRTLAPIERMMREQDRFLGDISHELRTPLASMAMELEAFQRGGRSKADAMAMTTQLRHEVGRLSGLVTGLMRLARLQHEAANSPEKIVPAVVGEAVNAAISRIEPLMTERRIQLQFTNESTARVTLKDDDLIQLFVILLDNAVKYSPEGEMVTVHLREEGPRCIVSVHNRGGHIASDDLPRVFDRFFRGSGAQAEGSGLGLAIARHLVESGGGSIAVAQQADGVVFRVILPSAR
jgi:signal transduction histidine kinase